MIDISSKTPMIRTATAKGTLFLNQQSLDSIREKTNPKGDVLENAKLAAIQAVKLTPQYIFMAHPININAVKVDFKVLAEQVECTVQVRAIEKTGVELEALSGVMGALMAIFDLSKRFEKDDAGQYHTAKITDIYVVSKLKEEVIS